MSYQCLQALAQSYSPGNSTRLLQLAKGYARRREQEILDIASVAANVSVNTILNLGLEPEAHSSLLRAFKMQFPSIDPSDLKDYSPEQLPGFVNGLKGKYFEVLVEEQLNKGAHLGELVLAPDQLARLADSPTQPGWDLEIINKADGSLAERIQLKATQSLSHIKEAFDRYPDFRIATTSDVDGTAEKILATNISHEEVTEAAQEGVTELSESAVIDIAHQTAEFALDALPIVPAVLIAVTEGSAILLGRSTMEDALQRGARRLKRASVFSALGAALSALDAGWISVPTTTAAQIAWGRMANRIEMGEFLQARTEALRLLV